jgi:hypothetical protein
MAFQMAVSILDSTMHTSDQALEARFPNNLECFKLCNFPQVQELLRKELRAWNGSILPI